MLIGVTGLKQWDKMCRQHKICDNEKKFFIEHLKTCSKIVNSWPDWKKDIFGKSKMEKEPKEHTCKPKLVCKNCHGSGVRGNRDNGCFIICSICNGTGYTTGNLDNGDALIYHIEFLKNKIRILENQIETMKLKLKCVSETCRGIIRELE